MMTLLAFGLMAVTLAVASRSAKVSGRRLRIALPVMGFGVGTVNALIEAVVFGVMPLSDVPKIVAIQLPLVCTLALAMIAASGKWREGDQAPSAPTLTPLRVAAMAACYAFVYLVAGMAVYPFVQDFYANKTLPSLTTVLSLQLVRGLLYVLYAWPWLRLAPRSSGLVLGLVYAILGGVAPLIADDNPYMPREVRLPHLVEVGVSNFIFGMVVGRLTRPIAPQERKNVIGPAPHQAAHGG